MRENDKDEQDFKPNRVDGEEIDGSELGYVIVEECSPGLQKVALDAAPCISRRKPAKF
jgi:hypothetical protein